MRTRAPMLWHLLPVGLLLFAGTAAAQARTAITGQVTDSSAQQPIAGAEVVIVGAGGATVHGARTDAAGRYVLSNLTAGDQVVRVRFVGYAPKERTVTVRDGMTTTADFALTPRSLQLDQVVITGTGGAVQKRAVGNVVETVNATDVVQTAAPRTVDQLVGARTPGVIVMPSSGQVGTGPQLRIRGASSLSLSNDPIIYIDGVRMSSDVQPLVGGVQRGGGGPSRINDIDPENIESIEIIKGPAAATLYGTEASNGVVQIITKRGRAGQARWDFSTRQGTMWLQNPEGRAGYLYGKVPATGNPCTGSGCTVFSSTCSGAPCQIVGFNLYQYDVANGNKPIFQNGRTQGYVASLSGGSQANSYFLSGSYDDDVGVVSWNWDKKFSGRANVDVQANNKLRLSGNVGYIRDRARLAQGAIDIDPFSNLVWGTPLTVNTSKRGFGFSPPEEWQTVESHGDNDRTTIGVSGTYLPFSWFSNRVTAGLDVSAQNNSLLYPRQPLGAADPLGTSNGVGNKRVDRIADNFLTLDYAGSAKYTFREMLDLTTSVGLQHYRRETSAISAIGTTFPATPITTISGGATRNGLETYQANATVGMYVQEEAGWKNRLFLVAALRGDDNSTFGKDFKAAYYPKVSGSWVMSEEPWFHVPGLDQLRLRAALGAAGTQPGAFDAQRLYDPSVGYQDQPGLVPFALGNPQLRPERSRELELGFETTVINRIDVSYTHYARKITDAIVNVPVAPSVGFPNNQIINIGRVKGWGDELGVNARIFDGRRVSWELGTQLANNGNRIEDMGGTQFLTVGGGGQAQNRVGFGIGDFFLYKVRSATLDATGKVTSAICDGGTGKSGLEQGGPDVSCSAAPRVYWGHSQPTWQAGLNSTVTLWQNLKLYARVDGNGGHLQSDTEIRALHNQGSTLGVIQQNDPLLVEYRAIEADAPGTYKAGFLRLRELSATYTVPTRYVSRFGASGASLGIAGRNLSMLWTAQHGWNTSRDGEIYVDINNQHVWDPEIRAVGQLSNGYQTILPQTASFTTTLRLNF